MKDNSFDLFVFIGVLIGFGLLLTVFWGVWSPKIPFVGLSVQSFDSQVYAGQRACFSLEAQSMNWFKPIEEDLIVLVNGSETHRERVV
ncbi:MAG: hypothetical protein GOV15_01095, partial [Candidatus Diapherotrites archaeon]|nr:hypothetical protein [Candidatus Diapherotrites archaeon]